jgi:hypothetical protein
MCVCLVNLYKSEVISVVIFIFKKKHKNMEWKIMRSIM